MDIVLGVSMTPTTVRMVLVEGERADRRTIDHDVFDVTAIDDAANSSAPDQVISAILGTQQSALAGGHRLIATGVTWSDHDEAAALRDVLASCGVDDVTLVSDLHAAGALAQAAGRAVGHDKTALMFVERDTATLSVVETRDGSIVKVLSRDLHSADAIAAMTEMITSLKARDARPQGVFVVGSGVDITSVKEHLEHLVSVPVSAPEDAAMALARGAALAAAGAPRFEATTVGLAYSQDPDASAIAATERRSIEEPAAVHDDAEVADESRRPFLLVGSTLTTIFVIGVVALVISLAVSIRPTVDQRPNPGESIVVPSTPAPTAPPVAEPVQPPVVQPPPETIKPPVPVVQEAPQQAPRQVVVEAQPAPAPAAPPPAAPPPAPEAPPPEAPPPAQVVPPPVYLPPPNYYPNYPVYIPPKKPWWYPFKPPWVDDDPPQQPPLTQPQQPPVTQVPSAPVLQQPVFPQQPVIPQQPLATQQPLVPLVPVIQQPVFPNQPTLPPIPVIQEPVVPQQPVIQQPQQPSGPIIRGRGNNPFWPF